MLGAVTFGVSEARVAPAMMIAKIRKRGRSQCIVRRSACHEESREVRDNLHRYSLGVVVHLRMNRDVLGDSFAKSSITRKGGQRIMHVVLIDDQVVEHLGTVRVMGEPSFPFGRSELTIQELQTLPMDRPS